MEEMKIIKKNKINRCFECTKRLGLCAIKCRCNNIFCAKHRYAEKHICSYNYKNNQTDDLKKELINIIPEKVSKI